MAVSHPRVGSLFSGYGGLDLGVESVFGNVERAWVSEIEPAPSRVLAHHYPDVPNLGDVTKVDWSTVPPVDILTGGFPCQDVSLAGARAGMKDGTRSGLWSEMARAIDVLRPGLVVIENVRGLLSAPAGKAVDADLERCPFCLGDDADHDLRALGAVLGDLADLGFDAEWGMLEAAAVGAPHRRARVFIVAWPRVRYAGHDAGGSELGVEPEIAGRWVGESGEVVADTDRDLFGEHGRESSAEETGPQTGHGSTDFGGGSRANRLIPTPTANEHTGAGHSASKTGAPNLRTVASMLPTPTVMDRESSGGSSTANVTLTDAVVRTDMGKARNARFDHVEAGELDLEGVESLGRFGQYAVAVQRWERVIGRTAPDPTEPGPKSGQRLSPRFVEWMMGLPDGHVTDVEISRAEQLKALGNGVVPQQAAAAVSALMGRVEKEIGGASRQLAA